VFGSSIGQGNYVQPLGEWISLESDITSNLFSGSYSFSDDQTINTETDSLGKLPKGIVALGITTWATADAAARQYSLGPVAAKLDLNWLSQINGILSQSGIVRMNSSGNFVADYTSGTLTNAAIIYTRVQVAP